MVKLLSVFLLAQLALALTPEQQAALDQLIQQRRGAVPARAGIGAIRARVKALEDRMTPLAFLFNRLGPQVAERAGYIDALEVFLKDPANITSTNPYADRAWLDKSHKEIMNICCEVRRNPRVAKTVQENLGSGKAPLTAEDYSNISSERTRTVILRPGREVLPTLPSRPGSKKGQTGFSNNMISGLPELSKPADPAPGTGANPGATGGAGSGSPGSAGSGAAGSGSSGAAGSGSPGAAGSGAAGSGSSGSAGSGASGSAGSGAPGSAGSPAGSPSGSATGSPAGQSGGSGSSSAAPPTAPPAPPTGAPPSSAPPASDAPSGG